MAGKPAPFVKGSKADKAEDRTDKGRDEAKERKTGREMIKRGLKMKGANC